MEKWFDPTVYMQNKLAQMQATDPAYTMTQLVADFAAAGFVGEEGYFNHFMQFGAAEEVAPNAYFNANEYYAAKAAQFYGEAFTGSELQIAQVKTLINKEGMNAWTHYQQFGSAEGVNPSNAFDAADYCAAKADAMNAAGLKDAAGNAWTAESIKTAIDQAGMSVLEHYLTYAGTGEGEVSIDATYPVPDDDQVVVPSGETIVIDELDSTIAYTGSAGDDKFYLKNAGTDLHPYNTLDGGEGNDTLILDSKDLGGATIRNIENLVVNRGTGTDYDMSLFATSFTLKGGSAGLTNVAGQKLVTDNATSLDVAMAAGQTSVDLTILNRAPGADVTLQGDSLSSVKLAVDEGVNGLDLKTAGADTKVTDLAITATVSEAENDAAQVNAEALDELANVTVAGAGAVELAVADGDKLKAVNAAENTGGVTVDLSGADNAAFTGGAGADKLTVEGSKVAHTLGAGDDTVVVSDATFADLAKGFSVDGGEGTDTLQMSATLAANFKTADVATNFEILQLVGGTGTVNMDNFGDIDHVAVGALNGAVTLNNMGNGGLLEYVATPSQQVTVNVKGADTGKTDVLNVTIADDETVTAGKLTVADVETINITADDTDLGEDELPVDHSMELAATNATNAITVNVSGDATLDLDLTSSANITKIDASGNTGGLTVSLKSFADVTLTGSSADDTITMGIGNFITGGEGDDTFTATVVGATLKAAESFSTIMDFGVGDKLVISGMNYLADDKVAVTAEMTFDEAVNKALGASTTGSTAAWFEYQGNTYVVLDVADADSGAPEAFAQNDYIVKLNGIVDLSDAVVDSGVLSLPEGA